MRRCNIHRMDTYMPYLLSFSVGGLGVMGFAGLFDDRDKEDGQVGDHPGVARV